MIVSLRAIRKDVWIWLGEVEMGMQNIMQNMYVENNLSNYYLMFLRPLNNTEWFIIYADGVRNDFFLSASTDFLVRYFVSSVHGSIMILCTW